MNKAKRNKRIVECIKKGMPYRRVAKLFEMSYQNISHIKCKYIPEFKYSPPYTPFGSVNMKGVSLLVVALLQCVVREYYKGEVTREELDSVGKYFGLTGLSKYADYVGVRIRRTGKEWIREEV